MARRPMVDRGGNGSCPTRDAVDVAIAAAGGQPWLTWVLGILTWSALGFGALVALAPSGTGPERQEMRPAVPSAIPWILVGALGIALIYVFLKKPDMPPDPRIVTFAMLVASVVLVVALAVFSVCFGVYLFAKDHGVVERAGEVIRSTLRFSITVALGACALLGFKT